MDAFACVYKYATFPFPSTAPSSGFSSNNLNENLALGLKGESLPTSTTTMAATRRQANLLVFVSIRVDRAQEVGLQKCVCFVCGYSSTARKFARAVKIFVPFDKRVDTRPSGTEMLILMRKLASRQRENRPFQKLILSKNNNHGSLYHCRLKGLSGVTNKNENKNRPGVTNKNECTPFYDGRANAFWCKVHKQTP